MVLVGDYSDRLQALFAQERTAYKTRDYLLVTPAPEEDEEEVASNNSFEELDCGTKKRKLFVSEEESTCSIADSRKASKKCKNETHTSGGCDDDKCPSNRRKYWREIMCSWTYQVADHFDISREVVFIATNYVDRYLSVSNAHDIEKKEFQLLAMTSLYLAVKLYEPGYLAVSGSKSTMDAILKLSRGFYTLEQMEKMEYELLQRLQWHVHPPTPHIFARHFLPPNSTEYHAIEDLASFMIELSVMDYFFVSYKASELAMAALLCAMDTLCIPDTFLTCHQQDLEHSRVVDCKERLTLLHRNASEDSPSARTNDGENRDLRESYTASPVSVAAACLR